jgi:hypothetical protein
MEFLLRASSAWTKRVAIVESREVDLQTVLPREDLSELSCLL